MDLCTPGTSYRNLSVGKFCNVYCVNHDVDFAFDRVSKPSITATTGDQLNVFEDTDEIIDQNLPSQAVGWIIKKTFSMTKGNFEVSNKS